MRRELGSMLRQLMKRDSRERLTNQVRGVSATYKSARVYVKMCIDNFSIILNLETLETLFVRFPPPL